MRRDCAAREMTREMVVGTFIVTAFLGLMYFTVILSREKWLFAKRHMYEAVFEHVMGLREGDSVAVRGMPVGRIERLHLATNGVHMLLKLNVPLDLREDYRLVIVTTSMLGGRQLEIREGSKDRPRLPPGQPLHGEKPYDIMEDAAAAINAVKREFEAGGTIANLREASATLRTVADRIQQGKGTVGRLLSEDDQLYRDLAETVAGLKSAAGRIGKGEGTLGRLVGEDGLYKEAEKILFEVRAAVDDFRESAPVVNFASIFFGAR